MYQKYLPKYLRKSLLKYLREIYLHERKMFYVTKFEESFSANVFVHNKAESSWMPIFVLFCMFNLQCFSHSLYDIL